MTIDVHELALTVPAVVQSLEDRDGGEVALPVSLREVFRQIGMFPAPTPPSIHDAAGGTAIRRAPQQHAARVARVWQ